MAKTVNVTLAGVDYQMPASYKVAKEIGQRVGDPLKMAIDAERGEIPWTFESVVDIIHIGAKAAGCALSHDDVGDALMDSGIPAALEAAANLIGQIVAGGPDKPLKGSTSKKS
jgi:hypothetical protein